MSKLATPYNGTDETKTLAAIEFRSKIFSGELIVDNETKSNFQSLFERLNVEIP